MDVFISHSSNDAEITEKVQKVLGGAGLTIWLDQLSMRFGVLLRDELLAAIRGSRVLVLLWSKAAEKSRWVASEILSAFHMGRFIVPVGLDKTRSPLFLQNTVYLDAGRSEEQVLENLPQAVREAPDTANQVARVLTHETLEQSVATLAIAQKQREETGAMMRGNLDEARRAHAEGEVMIRDAAKRWKYDLMVLALSGYHHKNAYLLKHWEKIQAGRKPKDPLQRRAEAKFFEALFVNPRDPSSLNGLGSVLIGEGEYYAAEFFGLRAIEFAEGPYPEAKHDLALARQYLPKRIGVECAPERAAMLR